MKLLLWVCLAMLPLACWGEPWRVSVGESGGFTGGGDSLTVRADGQVVRGSWSEAKAPPQERIIRTLSAQELKSLEKILNDPALVALRYNQPSNMTRFLHFQQGKVERSYSWSHGATPPAPLQRAYEAVLSAGVVKKP